MVPTTATIESDSPTAQTMQQFIVQCATEEDTRKLMAFISKSAGIACYQRVNPETWNQHLPSSLTAEGFPSTPRELQSARAFPAKGSAPKNIDYDASIDEERSPLVLDGHSIIEAKKGVQDSHSLSTLDDDSIPAGVDDVLRSPVVLHQGNSATGKKASGPLLKRTPRSSRRTAARRNTKELASLISLGIPTTKVAKSSAAQDDETSTKDSSTRRVTAKSPTQSQKSASNAKKNSKPQASSKKPLTHSSHPMSLDVADKKMEAGGRISLDKFRQGFVSPKTGKLVFVVRDILAYRKLRHKREYKVAWEGYPDSDATWEPASNIPTSEWKEECADARRRYEVETKRKAGVKRPRDPEVLSEFDDDDDLIALD